MAFSGGGGETRIIEKNNYNYIYVMLDSSRSRVESEEPRDDLKLHEVSSNSFNNKLLQRKSSQANQAIVLERMKTLNLNGKISRRTRHLNLKILEPPVVDEHLRL